MKRSHCKKTQKSVTHNLFILVDVFEVNRNFAF